MKQGFIHFYQCRQDSATGFFFDPHTRMRSVQRLRGRALDFSNAVLRQLEAAPLYPLPGQRQKPSAKAKDYLSYLESPENFQTWLEERPWDFSWGALDHICSQMGILKSLPEDRQQPLIDVLLPYLENRQNPETGLWGDGDPYVELSGAFMAAYIYKALDLPVPHADLIYQSLQMGD